MILEITTLGAGTYDVEYETMKLGEVLDNIESCRAAIGSNFFIFKQAPNRGGVPIILNLPNIVSIKAKR